MRRMESAFRFGRKGWRGVGTMMLAAAIAAGGAGPVAAQRPLKIGYVDVDLARTRSQTIQNAIKAVEDQLKQREGEIETLLREYQRARDQLQTTRTVLSEEQVRAEERKIQAQRDQIENLRLEVERQWRRSATEVIEPAVDRILEAIKRVAKANGYDLVLRSDVVLFGVDGIDLTPLVVQDLDRSAPAPALPDPDPPRERPR